MASRELQETIMKFEVGDIVDLIADDERDWVNRSPDLVCKIIYRIDKKHHSSPNGLEDCYYYLTIWKDKTMNSKSWSPVDFFDSNHRKVC